MVCLSRTVGGYWLKIRGIPPVFYGTREVAITFVEKGWEWFPIQLPEC